MFDSLQLCWTVVLYTNVPSSVSTFVPLFATLFDGRSMTWLSVSFSVSNFVHACSMAPDKVCDLFVLVLFPFIAQNNEMKSNHFPISAKLSVWKYLLREGFSCSKRWLTLKGALNRKEHLYARVRQPLPREDDQLQPKAYYFFFGKTKTKTSCSQGPTSK